MVQLRTVDSHVLHRDRTYLNKNNATNSKTCLNMPTTTTIVRGHHSCWETRVHCLYRPFAFFVHGHWRCITERLIFFVERDASEVTLLPPVVVFDSLRIAGAWSPKKISDVMNWKWCASGPTCAPRGLSVGESYLNAACVWFKICLYFIFGWTDALRKIH